MTPRWTKLAAEDLAAICEYSDERFGTNQTDQAVARVFEAISSLPSMPGKGRPGRVTGTRELPIAGLPFVIVYRQNTDRLEVLRILHGARQWFRR